MLTDADRARMRADLEEVRDDRAVSVIIRRGKTTLAAQSVRVARAGTGRSTTSSSEGMQAALSMVTVLGDTTLDIAPADRFTVAGMLYEVVSVHPNRDAAVIAEARLVQ
jgi:lipopolysaccharide export system protein LptA